MVGYGELELANAPARLVRGDLLRKGDPGLAAVSRAHEKRFPGERRGEQDAEPKPVPEKRLRDHGLVADPNQRGFELDRRRSGEPVSRVRVVALEHETRLQVLGQTDRGPRCPPSLVS